MRSLVLAALIAIAGASAPAADRPSFSHDIVVEAPPSLQTTLRQQLREGRTCAAVARSVGIRLATNVAVVLTRPEGPQAGAGLPATADARVLTATPGTVDELARRLDAAAAEGFSVCGLTLTSPVWGRPGGAFAVVAVLTRLNDAPTGVSYRAIHTSGRGEWADVQRAAADGFVVTRLASRPQPDVSSTSDIVYLAEKTSATRPMKYDLVLAGNGPALQKDLDKSTARGFCAQATWATPERMTVLLAKPIDAPCDRPHEYEIEETSAFTGLSVSSSDGALLGIHRVKDGTMALYDGRDRSLEYSVAEGVLADEDSNRIRPSRELRALRDKLNADGDRGFRPVDIAWRATASDGPRAVDVILARGRN